MGTNPPRTIFSLGILRYAPGVDSLHPDLARFVAVGQDRVGPHATVITGAALPVPIEIYQHTDRVAVSLIHRRNF